MRASRRLVVAGMRCSSILMAACADPTSEVPAEPSVAAHPSPPSPTVASSVSTTRSGSDDVRLLRELDAAPTFAAAVEVLRTRFGDEHYERRYAALNISNPDGAELLRRWTESHEIDPTIVQNPDFGAPGGLWEWHLGKIGCVTVKNFAQDGQAGKLAIIKAPNPAPRGPMNTLPGYTLYAYGTIPTPGPAARFCGVYTGTITTDQGQSWALVGVFDTRASRRFR